MSKLRFVIAALTLAGSNVAANAAVITFDGLAGTPMPGFYTRSVNSYGSSSTTFARNSVATINGFSFYDVGTNSTYRGASTGGQTGSGGTAWNGTDFLQGFNVFMKRISPFSVESVDLAQYQTSALYVTARGVRQDGTTITKVLSKPNTSNTAVANDFSTYTLTGFTDLKSLQLQTGTSFFALDNIKIAEAEVPEPASLGLLGLGLIGIGAATRRRK